MTRVSFVVLASLVCLSCTDAHTPARPTSFCTRLVAGTVASQPTDAGECVSFSVEPNDAPRSSPDFEVTGAYEVGAFGIIRNACEHPYLPEDPSRTDGWPVGTAHTTVDDHVVHLVIHARVEFSGRPGYEPVTRDVDVDTTFRDDEPAVRCVLR